MSARQGGCRCGRDHHVAAEDYPCEFHQPRLSLFRKGASAPEEKPPAVSRSIRFSAAESARQGRNSQSTLAPRKLLKTLTDASRRAALPDPSDLRDLPHTSRLSAAIAKAAMCSIQAPSNQDSQASRIAPKLLKTLANGPVYPRRSAPQIVEQFRLTVEARAFRVCVKIRRDLRAAALAATLSLKYQTASAAEVQNLQFPQRIFSPSLQTLAAPELSCCA